MDNGKNVFVYGGIVVAVVFLLVAIPSTSTPQMEAHAQQAGESFPTIPAIIQPDGTFQNVEDGIKLTIPANWGITDYDNADPEYRVVEDTLGFTYLALICNEQKPGLGGTTQCQVSPTSLEVAIERIKELDKRPEVQTAILQQNKSITPQDLSILYTNLLESTGGYHNLQLVNSTQRTINVIHTAAAESPTTPSAGISAIPATPATPTMTTVPATLSEYRYEDSHFTPARMYLLSVLTPDNNTGYVVSSAGHPSPGIPPAIQEIFNSFQLIQ